MTPEPPTIVAQFAHMAASFDPCAQVVSASHVTVNERALRARIATLEDTLASATHAALGEDTYCLAHAHNSRVAEAICSLRFQRDTAHTRLRTAVALLAMARCPDDNGNNHVTGADNDALHKCRFCEERNALTLATKEPTK